MKRSAAIYILAIIAIMAGIVAVIDTLRYLQWLFSPLSFIGSPFLGAGLSAIVAAIWFWAAVKIWNVDAQGWIFMVTIAAIYLIWGSTYLAIRFAVETLPPFLMLFARFFTAGVLMYLFLCWRGESRPTAREWLGGAVIGGLLLLGGTAMLPTINYPEVAILGMGRVQEKPVVRDGEIVIRKILPLTLAFDHRIADGADAARFVGELIRQLSDPNLLLLET